MPLVFAKRMLNAKGFRLCVIEKTGEEQEQEKMRVHCQRTPQYTLLKPLTSARSLSPPFPGGFHSLLGKANLSGSDHKASVLAVFQSLINRDPTLHRRLLPKIHWVLTTKYKPGVVACLW